MEGKVKSGICALFKSGALIHSCKEGATGSINSHDTSFCEIFVSSNTLSLLNGPSFDVPWLLYDKRISRSSHECI